MPRVLIVHYSQTGEVARAVQAFADTLAASGCELTIEALAPVAPYPYPWRSLFSFFDVMPECVLGIPPPIHPPSFDLRVRFDLVVIAYPVWFLNPAPPVQAFLASFAAVVLGGTDVVTIVVSRAMWYHASETMKALLASAGAHHSCNIAVTHAGSSLATLVTTPASLLLGADAAVVRHLGAASVRSGDLEQLASLGHVVGARLIGETWCERSRLRDEPAVVISRSSAVAELFALGWFHLWARALRALGRIGRGSRTVGVLLFIVTFVPLIAVGLPLAALVAGLARLFIPDRFDRYLRRLAEPPAQPSRAAT